MHTETSPEATADSPPLSGALVGEPGKKLRICVLHPSAEGTAGPFTEEVDGICAPDYYDPEGQYEWTNVFLLKASATADLIKLVNSGKYDVYLNLCDGAWDEDRAGRDVVEALERLNVPYTGADAAFYEPSKIDMKKAAYFYGIQVPAWVHILGSPGQEEIGLAEVLAPPEQGGLSFPLIVKHPSGYGSVGMTKQAKVTNEEQLRQQVSFFVKEYGGALVEEFIAGREFTVLVVEEPPKEVGDDPQLSDLVPVAYTPVECVFGPGEDFKHFDLKFIDFANMGWQPCKDPELAARLKAAARDTYLATRGVSYGRCDFRVDTETGDIYFLEINPNCGVLYPPELAGSADFILTLDPDHNHRHFIAAILASAVHRHRCKQPAVAPAFISVGTAQPAALPITTADGNASDSPDADAGGSGEGKAPEAVVIAAVAEAMDVEPPEGEPTADGTKDADAEAQGTLTPAVEGVKVACTTEAVVAAPPALTPKRRSGCCGRRLGMVAVRPILRGRVVQSNEHSQFTLASRTWIERNWPAGSRERKMFNEAAYPLNEQVLVMPPTDLTKWTPLTHSCDPNTQLEGLNLVARRDIARGEIITIDFATLYGPKLSAPFDCICGAIRCRGRITPQDFMLPYITEEYSNEHMSSFVQEARNRSLQSLPAEL
ncbi:hypothetical protein Vretimale_12916 [Volvox reticuliferus]|uniref:Uncharacterized protein n=1 Tax=Volvox reticuliferus TaxID=1737510 RepID=A0A8J4CE93_9CHLO|nr:hypothetical protein Vretifemale_9279 [Volvox reticuliferus]GIM09016.1 hypothetical protein Vretimale_12916 [Volvox reticuliferus]